ncbi:hypothetical protein N7G274_005396 [Stereocaulon virgatum]|uniref:Uncharacterized protein n=1 Tax=Stereocaulon virgatum TaxID=373712 RepID=A0ABR4AAV1_9LECA
MEDDLTTIQDARMSGDGEWFSAKDNYLDGAGFVPKAPDVLWVTGKPASGKSVIAGYVIVHVEAKAKSVWLQNDNDRAALVEKVLKQSEGCFLWTVLVLSKLSNRYGEGGIKQALEEIPQDMIPLYQRILEMMNHAVGRKRLAKAILTWATCSTSPLTTRELTGALEIGFKDRFPRFEENVLASILIDEDLKSKFAIDETEAHTRLARACLTYLAGEENKPPRTSRRGSVNDITGTRGAFPFYASAAFSYHLARAEPPTNDVRDLADKLSKTNVLPWIEVIARTHNLIHLIRAAEDLQVYLTAYAAERSTLDSLIQTIRGWVTDLIRVVAKFADALATLPSAQYLLVLLFCPTESMIHKIGNPRRRLAVVGLSNFQWNYRLSCIDFYQGQASAVCNGDDFLAVGLITGTIALYHATSCQQYKVLDHGEAVNIL